MISRILFIITLVTLILPLTKTVQSESLPPTVSIFSVKQEKVVKVLPLTTILHRSVIEALQSSPVVYDGFSMNPKDGLVLHIPFTNAIQINNEIYTDKIKEIYVFLEQRQLPKALVFYNANNKHAIVILNYATQKIIDSFDLQQYWTD